MNTVGQTHPRTPRALPSHLRLRRHPPHNNLHGKNYLSLVLWRAMRSLLTAIQQAKNHAYTRTVCTSCLPMMSGAASSHPAPPACVSARAHVHSCTAGVRQTRSQFHLPAAPPLRRQPPLHAWGPPGCPPPHNHRRPPGRHPPARWGCRRRPRGHHPQAPPRRRPHPHARCPRPGVHEFQLISVCSIISSRPSPSCPRSPPRSPRPGAHTFQDTVSLSALRPTRWSHRQRLSALTCPIGTCPGTGLALTSAQSP